MIADPEGFLGLVSGSVHQIRLMQLLFPEPAWNFLFFCQALKYFKGRFEPAGTSGLPLIGVLIMVLIPFVHRRERNSLKRPFAVGFLAVSAAMLLWLTSAGYGSSSNAASSPAPAPAAAPAVSASPGAKVFSANNCSACHKINGVGGTVGSDLSNEGKKHLASDWLQTQIRNPKAHNPDSIMHAFKDMSAKDLDDLVDYLEGCGEKANIVSKPAKAADTDKGAKIFSSNDCSACHGINGVGGTFGPDLSKEAERNRTSDWLSTQITKPKAHNPSSIMPASPKIGKGDLSVLIGYLQSLGAKGVVPPNQGSHHDRR